MAPLDVELHDRLDDVPWWDDVAGFAGLYSSSRWMRIFEPLAPRYVTVREPEGAPVALAAVYAATAPRTLPRPCEPPWILHGDPAADGLFPFAFAGSPRGYTNRLLVRPGVTPELRRQAVRRLLETARELAAGAGAALLAVGYIRGEEMEEVAAVLPALAVYAGCEAYLPVQPFDDYLASLNHHRRYAVRRELRRFEAEGLRLVDARFGDVLDASMPLVLAHMARYGLVVPPERGRAELARWATAWDEDARALCAYRGHELEGVACFIRHGDALYCRFAACSEDRVASPYFTLTFYEALRAAHAGGLREIHYGIETLEAKLNRGCRTRLLWSAVLPMGDWHPAIAGRVREASRARLATDMALVERYGAGEDGERLPADRFLRDG